MKDINIEDFKVKDKISLNERATFIKSDEDFEKKLEKVRGKLSEFQDIM